MTVRLYRLSNHVMIYNCRQWDEIRVRVEGFAEQIDDLVRIGIRLGMADSAVQLNNLDILCELALKIGSDLIERRPPSRRNNIVILNRLMQIIGSRDSKVLLDNSVLILRHGENN